MTFTTPENDLDLYMTFKTRALAGTLLYTDDSADGSFLELFLIGGVLRLMASCGENSVLYVDTDTRVDNDTLLGVDIRYVAIL